MMRLYVAAPWVRRAQACEAADYLRAEGFLVQARWLRGHEDTANPLTLQAEAIADVEDVLACDVFVLLNLAKSEGKATELGIAYCAGKPVVVVGPKSGNIFYHLPGVDVVECLRDAVDALHKIERME